MKIIGYLYIFFLSIHSVAINAASSNQEEKSDEKEVDEEKSNEKAVKSETKKIVEESEQAKEIIEEFYLLQFSYVEINTRKKGRRLLLASNLPKLIEIHNAFKNLEKNPLKLDNEFKFPSYKGWNWGTPPTLTKNPSPEELNLTIYELIGQEMPLYEPKEYFDDEGFSKIEKEEFYTKGKFFNRLIGALPDLEKEGTILFARGGDNKFALMSADAYHKQCKEKNQLIEKKNTPKKEGAQKKIPTSKIINSKVEEQPQKVLTKEESPIAKIINNQAEEQSKKKRWGPSALIGFSIFAASLKKALPSSSPKKKDETTEEKKLSKLKRVSAETKVQELLA